jgi:tetratricopeptide (TPR) repeat protein
MGYRLLRQHGRQDGALAIFRKVVELYPGSTNAYDSLSEALEAAGSRAEALSVAKRGLEALEKETLTPERKQQLGDLLRERVKRVQ